MMNFAWETLDIGDSFTFGTYPHTAAGDDRTPVRWLVTEMDGDTVTLMSKMVLDRRFCYYSYRDGNAFFKPWEKTDLRNWLQTEFKDRAFSPAEQALLLPIPGVNGGPADLVSLPEGGDIAYPTEYAERDCSRKNEGNPIEWWLRLEGPGRHSLVDQWLIDREGIPVFRCVDESFGVRPTVRLCLPDALPLLGSPEKRVLPLNSTDPAPGDIVSFGRKPLNGKPFPWLVLDRTQSDLLLLSECELTRAPYDRILHRYDPSRPQDDFIRWTECTLRKELNDDWLGRIFSDEETARILEVRSDPQEAPDRLFLLDEEIFERYMPLMKEKTFRSHPWWIRNREFEDDPDDDMGKVAFFCNKSFICEMENITDEFSLRPAVWVRFPG